MNRWEERLLDRQDGYDEGLEVGKVEGIRQAAKNFKIAGIPIDVIAKNTGLTIEEIEEL